MRLLALLGLHHNLYSAIIKSNSNGKPALAVTSRLPWDRTAARITGTCKTYLLCFLSQGADFTPKGAARTGSPPPGLQTKDERSKHCENRRRSGGLSGSRPPIGCWIFIIRCPPGRTRRAAFPHTAGLTATSPALNFLVIKLLHSFSSWPSHILPAYKRSALNLGSAAILFEARLYDPW